MSETQAMEVSAEQRKEFRSSAIELAAITVPSVAAGIYSEVKYGRSAQIRAMSLMESVDGVFSFGVFFTEKQDRLGNHKRALRTRQGFAAGHIGAAAIGVGLGLSDIVNDSVPEKESMLVAGLVASASFLSYLRDKARISRRTSALAESENQPSSQSAFHSLNADFVGDMKLTNVAEAGGGMLAVIAQHYNENGSAALTIVSSLIVAGIMGHNIKKQQDTYSQNYASTASYI